MFLPSVAIFSFLKEKRKGFPLLSGLKEKQSVFLDLFTKEI
jgi:hypothetical protein